MSRGTSPTSREGNRGQKVARRTFVSNWRGAVKASVANEELKHPCNAASVSPTAPTANCYAFSFSGVASLAPTSPRYRGKAQGAVDERLSGVGFRVDQLEMHACDAPAHCTIVRVIQSAASSISRDSSDALCNNSCVTSRESRCTL